ncbi:MAG TPA: hypothetical protein VFX98_06795 [Longimicrobiaceae bacterium]|nr:hypothetical protein [Longimicrobiaceae bacterium]
MKTAAATERGGRTGERIAQFLQLGFQGWFMCRIATDPDPTNEQRGISGYTMALASEPPLDQVIRLQPGPKVILREPGEAMGIRVGVDVNSVQFNGAPYAPGEDALLGAKVELTGANPPFEGPIFDSRNNLVGSDDNMTFVVNPFQLEIRGKGVTIRAEDYLNPADPEQPIWEIEDPATYARRLPVFNGSSQEVMALTKVFDQANYFQSRLRFLRQRKAELEALRRPKKPDPVLETRIQELETRIYQIDFWFERFQTKLEFQLSYGFRINGPQVVEDRRRLLRGTADTAHPWQVGFWFGGWDGDLLVGYMQGSLGIPFRPDPQGS